MEDEETTPGGDGGENSGDGGAADDADEPGGDGTEAEGEGGEDVTDED